MRKLIEVIAEARPTHGPVWRLWSVELGNQAGEAGARAFSQLRDLARVARNVVFQAGWLAARRGDVAQVSHRPRRHAGKAAAGSDRGLERQLRGASGPGVAHQVIEVGARFIVGDAERGRTHIDAIG